MVLLYPMQLAWDRACCKSLRCPKPSKHDRLRSGVLTKALFLSLSIEDTEEFVEAPLRNLSAFFCFEGRPVDRGLISCKLLLDILFTEHSSITGDALAPLHCIEKFVSELFVSGCSTVTFALCPTGTCQSSSSLKSGKL